jgi:heptosyltransferase-2
MPEKLLVRSTNWIGDAAMSVAALREIRRQQPHLHIVVAGPAWVSGVFHGQDFVDSLIELPQSGNRCYRVWEEARLLRGFEQVLIFTNSFATAFASFLAGAVSRLGYSTDGRGILLTGKAVDRSKSMGSHQVYYYLDLISQTGFSDIDYLDGTFLPDTSLHVSRSGSTEANRLLAELKIDRQRPLVLLNPGAQYGPAKRWFPDRYAHLADSLIDSRRVEVGIIGSKNDIDVAKEIGAQMRHSPHIMAGLTSISGLLGLLSESQLLITNDSGPMHLAAALNVPQIALFGSTDEKATGPLSQNAWVINEHVECSPCLLRECPIDSRCFDRIQVDHVLGKALKLIDPEPLQGSFQ